MLLLLFVVLNQTCGEADILGAALILLVDLIHFFELIDFVLDF